MAGLTREQRAAKKAAKAAESARAEETAREAGAVDVEITVEVAGDQAGDMEQESIPPVHRHEDSQPSATEEPDMIGLVLMVKDGETLPVHPTCVRAHINAGWKAVE